MSLKNPMTPAGIELVTFRFVAQHLNHCATAVPRFFWEEMKIVAVTHNENNDAYCTGCLCQIDEGKKLECQEYSMLNSMHMYCTCSAGDGTDKGNSSFPAVSVCALIQDKQQIRVTTPSQQYPYER